jgi:hypothetical protein
LDFDEQRELLNSSKQVHSEWYLEAYPDVAALGFDPAEHYLRYGAAMRRNPGKDFDTRFYLETYPDAAESGLNPLLHYVLHGQQKGYERRPPRSDPRKQIHVISTKLLSLGFTEWSLAELGKIVDTSHDPEARALAARELALWHMRDKSEAGWRTSLEFIARARHDASDLDFRTKLAIAEMLCHYNLGDRAAGLAAYERVALTGEVTPDTVLARSNFQPTPEGRLAWINDALARHGIEPVALLPDEGQFPYDRLTVAAPLPRVEDGPKVSVLIAAYESGAMLPTALRSLQEQTWANLEIIVIDDASPSPKTVEVAKSFAAADPRIRVLRMEENGGAYIARNRGLDEATGEFVTLHDADDWSHPHKIETQVRFMLRNPEVMGCTSEQARCSNSLEFLKLRYTGGFIVFNTSSFLWRREPVRAKLGYWDTVRFGADSEFIRRVQVAFGTSATVRVPTGPLSLQRDSNSSITSDPIKGLDSQAYGVRREYQEAQDHHHRCAGALKYRNDPKQRPFPVPPMMMGDGGDDRLFDVVIYCDVTEGAPDIEETCQMISLEIAAGNRVGLVNAPGARRNILNVRIVERVRKLVAEGALQIIVYGESVRARRVVRRADDAQVSRLIPRIQPISES